MGPWKRMVEEIIDRALEEDLGWGDVTTDILVPGHLKGKGTIIMKASGVVAGLEVAALVFERVDPTLSFSKLAEDSAHMNRGETVAQVEGSAAGILKGERTALNFLQRMSGIATETARYVSAVAGLPARILDTRKTVPGLRALEKYAVRMGGGHNHRFNLGDGILIKDNHLAAGELLGLTLSDVVRRARERAPHPLKVEVEVETLEQVREALEAGAEVVLLDNMGIEEMAQAVALCKGRALTEASGGIVLDNVRAVAETGVDLISVGALTHSVKALDISLDLEIG